MCYLCEKPGGAVCHYCKMPVCLNVKEIPIPTSADLQQGIWVVGNGPSALSCIKCKEEHNFTSEAERHLIEQGEDEQNEMEIAKLLEQVGNTLKGVDTFIRKLDKKKK